MSSMAQLAQKSYEMIELLDFTNEIDLFMKMVISNLVVSVNQNIALKIIEKNSSPTKEQKIESKEILKSLNEVAKITQDSNVYHSCVGLKAILESYLNDKYMQNLGFEIFNKIDFNIIEYGIECEKIDKSTKEWEI